MKRHRVSVFGAVAALAGGAMLVFLSCGKPSAASRFQPRSVAGQDLLLLPESERPFARVVIGLGPSEATQRNPLRGATDPRLVDLRRRLYGLRFELLQGKSMTAVPDYATFYVAVPDPATVPERFRRGGGRLPLLPLVASRLVGGDGSGRASHFFRVARPVLYPQDMAEVLGHDGAGRLVLGVGGDTDPVYADPVARLAKAFPDAFSVRTLRGVRVGDVNTEGGDLALSWLPDGSIGLLVGRHRAIRYLERRTGEYLLGRPLTSDRIEEVRHAFSSAFFGVPVVIVGEGALRDPARGSEELFHADMAVAVVRNAREALAFVPDVREPSDGRELRPAPSTDFVRDVQKEYDLVAEQMAALGYRVVRLPFEDHPVRAPVNVSKFVEATSGKPVVLLARYPEHRSPAPGVLSAMAQLQDAVLALQARLDAWEAAPSDASLAAPRGRPRGRVARGRRGGREPEPALRPAARALRGERPVRRRPPALPERRGRRSLPAPALEDLQEVQAEDEAVHPAVPARDDACRRRARTSVDHGPANSPESPAPLK